MLPPPTRCAVQCSIDSSIWPQRSEMIEHPTCQVHLVLILCALRDGEIRQQPKFPTYPIMQVGNKRSALGLMSNECVPTIPSEVYSVQIMEDDG